MITSFSSNRSIKIMNDKRYCTVLDSTIRIYLVCLFIVDDSKAIFTKLTIFTDYSTISVQELHKEIRNFEVWTFQWKILNYLSIS